MVAQAWRQVLGITVILKKLFVCCLAGFKDENGVLPRDAIRKQFNGSLFYEYAAKMGKSMKEKKGHGKHLQ